MKITNEQLKQIIKEELDNLMNEYIDDTNEHIPLSVNQNMRPEETNQYKDLAPGQFKFVGKNKLIARGFDGKNYFAYNNTPGGDHATESQQKLLAMGYERI